MKKFLFIIVLIAMFQQSGAQQNLVPNPGFEDTLFCPVDVNTGIGAFPAKDWRRYTRGTPDYFHMCNTNRVGVPANAGGYQNAAQGNAYAAVIAYSLSNYEEYLAAQITPMQPGKPYEVSMSISRADSGRYGANNIGVYFYDTNTYYHNTVYGRFSYSQPHISYADYGILDTVNWTRARGYMIADSAYDNIVIGDFRNNSATSVADFPQTHSIHFGYAYYYIDSVVVREVKHTIPVGTDTLETLLCAGDTFQLNYITLKDYNASNIFTVQLSNASGSFNNAIALGSLASDTTGSITCVTPSTLSNGSNYKLQIMSSSPADTVILDEVFKIANIDSTNIIVALSIPPCVGDTVKFAAGTNVPGTTYSWTGPNSFSDTTANPYIPNATSLLNGDYNLQMKFHGCTVDSTINVKVNGFPINTYAIYSGNLCVGETLKLDATHISIGTYVWEGPNGFSSTVKNPSRTNISIADSGYYKVKASINGCYSSPDSVFVSVKPAPFVVIYPTPSDTLCTGESAVFNALPNNAGQNLHYEWTVNAQYASSSVSYTSNIINDGDIVICKMIDSTRCSEPYTDISNSLTMKVLPNTVPSVQISANPTGPLKPYQYVTFTASATNAGATPRYQWLRNSNDQSGATSATWSANTLQDNDTISVEVKSSNRCAIPQVANSNVIIVNVLTTINGAKMPAGLVVYPNPSNGIFRIEGGLVTDEEVEIKLVNNLGSTVFKENITIVNNKISKQLDLTALPAGMYRLIFNYGEYSFNSTLTIK